MDFTHLVFTIDDSCKIQTTWALIPGTELARISHQVAGCYRIWMFGLKSVCPNQAGKKVSLGTFV